MWASGNLLVISFLSGSVILGTKFVSNRQTLFLMESITEATIFFGSVDDEATVHITRTNVCVRASLVTENYLTIDTQFAGVYQDQVIILSSKIITILKVLTSESAISIVKMQEIPLQSQPSSLSCSNDCFVIGTYDETLLIFNIRSWNQTKTYSTISVAGHLPHSILQIYDTIFVGTRTGAVLKIKGDSFSAFNLSSTSVRLHMIEDRILALSDNVFSTLIENLNWDPVKIGTVDAFAEFLGFNMCVVNNQLCIFRMEKVNRFVSVYPILDVFSALPRIQNIFCMTEIPIL